MHGFAGKMLALQVNASSVGFAASKFCLWWLYVLSVR
jgi:hypothetical protein